MKATLRKLTIHHLARWIFAMLLTPLICGAANGTFPDIKVETVVNRFSAMQIYLPRRTPAGTSISAWGAPISREDYGPFHGSFFLGGSTVHYKPYENFMGTDQFKYSVRSVEGKYYDGLVIITVKNGISITDTSIAETTSVTRTATFTVSLVLAPANVVSVSYRTVPGTALPGSDYVRTVGTLSFGPGIKSQTISVPVIGDLLPESSETFFVQLFNPGPNAIITGDGTGVGTILDFAGSRTPVGSALQLGNSVVVEAGVPVVFSLSWVHPEGWQQLESIDLLIVDDEDEVMAVHWNEAENSFSLYNPATDQFDRTARAGGPNHFESSSATMFLEESTGGGPPGQTVTVRYGLVFKPQAARRTFRVETFATDDAGRQQGFEQVGTITVLPQ